MRSSSYYLSLRDEMIRAQWQRLAAERLPGGICVAHNQPHDPQRTDSAGVAWWLIGFFLDFQGSVSGEGNHSGS